MTPNSQFSPCQLWRLCESCPNPGRWNLVLFCPLSTCPLASLVLLPGWGCPAGNVSHRTISGIWHRDNIQNLMSLRDNIWHLITPCHNIQQFLNFFLSFFYIFLVLGFLLWIFFFGFFGLFFFDIWIFWNFLKKFGFSLDFFGFLEFLLKLLRLLLKVTKVATGHQKLSKMGRNSILSFFFFARRAKKSLGRRPKPTAGARSRPA